MPQKRKTTSLSTVRSVKKGGTIYRVTSVFTGEKNLAEALEKLAVRRVYKELSDQPEVR